jgi:recombinational DNA repair protein RecR
MRVKQLYDMKKKKKEREKQLGEILGEVVKLFKNCFCCNEKYGSSKSCVNPSKKKKFKHLGNINKHFHLYK